MIVGVDLCDHFYVNRPRIRRRWRILSSLINVLITATWRLHVQFLQFLNEVVREVALN